MPDTGDNVQWSQEMNQLPGPWRHVLVFLRLSTWQMLILILMGLMIFYMAKDMGWVDDKRTAEMHLMLKYLEGNALSLQQIVRTNEKHMDTTEQIARFMCWNSNIPESDKRIACTK